MPLETAGTQRIESDTRMDMRVQAFLVTCRATMHANETVEMACLSIGRPVMGCSYDHIELSHSLSAVQADEAVEMACLSQEALSSADSTHNELSHSSSAVHANEPVEKMNHSSCVDR